MTMFMPKTSDLSEGETPDRAVKHEQRSANTVHAVLPPPPPDSPGPEHVKSLAKVEHPG